MALVIAGLVAGACGGGGSGSGAKKGDNSVVVGMINQEDAPVGSFPETRQAAQAAVAHVNNDLGGVNGRPIRLEVCTTSGTPESSAACANKLVGDQPLAVLGGVDLGAFAPAPQRSPRPAILFSGAVTEPRKGVSVLLAALPLIAATEPEVELWLSGPGDPAELLAGAPPGAAERVCALGVGAADAQSERYGRAWVTCLPSTHDSFGMALLESLACGTPLVTTTHSAPQDLVDEGITGELSVPGDAASLAQACLRGFALARRAETVSACRASAEPYDWDGGLAPLCERLYTGAPDSG